MKRADLDYKCIIKKLIGLGNCTLFWHDIWWGNDKLKSKFPELFALESNKCCLVQDHVTPTGYSWDWNANPWSGNLNQNLGHF